MGKRISSEDFLLLAEALWEGKAKVKYKNPDAWISYLTKSCRFYSSKGFHGGRDQSHGVDKAESP